VAAPLPLLLRGLPGQDLARQLGKHEEVFRYELRAVARVLESLKLLDNHVVLHNGGGL
jgi:hypothetical protein